MWWFAVGVWQFCGSVSAFTVYGKWKRLSMRTNGTYGTHGTHVGIALVLAPHLWWEAPKRDQAAGIFSPSSFVFST